MSGCLDNIHCDCGGIDWDAKRNAVASIVAGVMVGSDYFYSSISTRVLSVFRRLVVVHRYGGNLHTRTQSMEQCLYNCWHCGHGGDVYVSHHPVVVNSRTSWFRVNAVSNSQVRGESMSEGMLGTRGIK
jgi:hypothetical protein